MSFRVISNFVEVETIARGRGILELKRLRRIHGIANWRKRKGIALIEFQDGSIFRAELHWYEANGVGKRELKIKKLISKI